MKGNGKKKEKERGFERDKGEKEKNTCTDEWIKKDRSQTEGKRILCF